MTFLYQQNADVLKLIRNPVNLFIFWQTTEVSTTVVETRQANIQVNLCPFFFFSLKTALLFFFFLVLV